MQTDLADLAEVPEDALDQVQEICNRIRPMFAHQHPAIIGAVLAELLSTLLASYRGEDAPALREELLAAHISTVEEMTAEIDATMTAEISRKR